MLRYIVCLLLLSVTVNGVLKPLKKNWEYTIISVDANTSDSNIIEYDLKVTRLGRGSYAVSGNAYYKVEIDDRFYVQLYVYRSATGSSIYQLMPMRNENQTLSSWVNNIYKEYLMSSIKECSNLPQFEDKWIPPMPPTHFTLKNCTIFTDKLPSYMPIGFYKFVVSVSRFNFKATLIAIAKIENLLT